MPQYPNTMEDVSWGLFPVEVSYVLTFQKAPLALDLIEDSSLEGVTMVDF